MLLYLIALLAGVLTALSPCVLPMLPVIVGGSLTERKLLRPLIITSSLVISIIIFTFVLKVSTVFIDIPSRFWNVFSGVLVLIVGLSMLFPQLWSKFMFLVFKGKDSSLSHGFLAKFQNREDSISAVMLGVALGPVFASCSPVYFLILSTILPESFGNALILLILYAIGLGSIMFAASYAGQKVVKKFKLLSRPDGKFKKAIGIILVLVAISIASGLDKQIEIFLLESGILGVSNLEYKLLDLIDNR